VPIEFDAGLDLLGRTPSVLRALLIDLPDGWTRANEGEGTWSPYDVVGHLIHGERTDWVPRMRIILSDAGEKTFEPFDRWAQERESAGQSLRDLLETFATLRSDSIEVVRSFDLAQTDFGRTGVHPEFGKVTLGQLFSTWVAHDLDHLVQTSRVLAHRLGPDVGPWREYLRVIRDPVA